MERAVELLKSSAAKSTIYSLEYDLINYIFYILSITVAGTLSGAIISVIILLLLLQNK